VAFQVNAARLGCMPAHLAERPGRAGAYAAGVTRGDLDLIISGLVKLRREVDLALDRAVLTGRAEHDLSWDEVAALTGVTTRTAAKRWSEPGAGAKNAGASKNGAAAKDGVAAKNGAAEGAKARKGGAGRSKAGAATTRA